MLKVVINWPYCLIPYNPHLVHLLIQASGSTCGLYLFLEEIFTWRALLNILPTINNLYKRKVLDYPNCQRCQIAKEVAFHALLSCKVVRNIWKNSTLASVLNNYSFNDFYNASLYLHFYYLRINLNFCVVLA